MIVSANTSGSLHYVSGIPGEKCSFADGLSRGMIRLLSPDELSCQLLTLFKSVSVHHVIHPVTMKCVSYEMALAEGSVEITIILFHLVK